jgi:hypothetical protein
MGLSLRYIAAIGGGLWFATMPAAAAPGLVDRLVDGAAAHVARFVATASVLLAREHYDQEATTRTGPSARFATSKLGLVTEQRTLESEVALVQIGDDRLWLIARDILAVDGKPVREEDRVRIPPRIDGPADQAFRAFRRVADQGARYNIGRIRRDLNVPTLALWFLSEGIRQRFAFTIVGEERLGDVSCRIVRYVERERPYLLHAEDRPARVEGRFWIADDSAAVLRTELVLRSPPGATPGRAAIEVDYAFAPSVDAWAPREMRERYETGPNAANLITGTARYDDYRRFSIDTRITVPD